MNGSRSSLQRIPIFNYHTITDTPEPGIAHFAVRPDELARHLDLIVSRGCSALTVSGLVDLLDRNLPPPAGTVLITFDDGYQDNLTVAAGLLNDRGIPATVYATTGLLPVCPGGSLSRPMGPMIPWGRLSELEAAGIEVGSHTHNHPQLDVVSRSVARWEIRHSKELLEDALGHAVQSFAYPHGYATRWLQQEVRRCGFRSACGVRNAFSHPQDNRWLLSRLVVGPTTTCAQVNDFLSGAGARTASSREQLRTKVWREVRRTRASLAPAPTFPNGVMAHATST